MVKLRSQEDDLKGKVVETVDPIERRLSLLEEANAQRFSKLEEMFAALMKMRGGGSDHVERFGDDRRFGGGQFRDGADDDDETRTERNSVMKGETDLLEDESMPRFQVPVSASENFRSNELGKSDSELEKLDHVVMNEDLEQEWDQMSVKEKLEVDGDGERDHKLISDANSCYAHKVLVKMPNKEKRMKHLKAWKFKFKPISKRNRLMDIKFFSAEGIAGFKKDSKEIYGGCVNKEFKEVVAACGKTRVDQFKLVDKNELRSEVLDQIVTFMYHQALDSDSTQKPVHVKEMEAPLYSHKSTGNNLHHIAHQLLDKRCLRIHSKKLKTKCLKSWRFKFKISSRKARPKLFCLFVDGYKATRIYYGIIGFVRFLELCYTLNLFVKLQEMSCFLSEKSLVEFVGYKAHERELLVVGVKQLTLAATKFYLKYKWRSRLLQSFSELKQRIIMSLWKSFGYLMEVMEEDQKQQGDSEPLVIVPDFDAKVCVTFDQYIRRKGSVVADHETKNNQPTLTFLRSTTQSYLSLQANRVWDPGGSNSEND